MAKQQGLGKLAGLGQAVAPSVWRLGPLAAGLVALLSGCSPAQWVEVRSPHFVVDSDGGEDNARSLAEDLEVSWQLIGRVGFEREDGPVGVVRVVHVAEPGTDLGSGKSVGWFNRQGGLRWASQPILVVTGRRVDEAKSIVVHELVHRFVAHFSPRTPTWLNEGLATFLETSESVYGRAQLGNRAAWYAAMLEHESMQMPPFAELVQLGGSDATKPFYAQEPGQRSANYGAALLAVDVLHSSPDWIARLRSYQQACIKGVPERRAWAAAFPPAVEQQLASAVDLRLHTPQTHRFAVPFQSTPVTLGPVRTLPPAEIALLRAWVRDWEHPDRTARNRADLESGLALDPGNLELQLAYADELWEADPTRARSAYSEVTRHVAKAPDAAPERVVAAVARYLLSHEQLTDEQEQTLAALRPHLMKSRDVWSRLAMAQIMLRHGRPETATRFAAEAVTAESSCVPCYRVGAEAALASGKLRLAVEAEELGAGLAAEGSVPQVRQFVLFRKALDEGRIPAVPGLPPPDVRFAVPAVFRKQAHARVRAAHLAECWVALIAGVSTDGRLSGFEFVGSSELEPQLRQLAPSLGPAPQPTDRRYPVLLRLKSD